MMLTVIVTLLVALAILAAVIAMQPAEFRLARSRTLAAPPAVVHPFLDDFHRWKEWSPWEKLDPAMKREFSGPAAGTGAGYYWLGNSKAGEGRMTITDSRPPEGVTIRLEFLKPFKATNTTQFDLVPAGAGTEATWTMTGRDNFVAKAFHLFMNMEKMVGPDFEKGLANLDAATAAEAKR
jgi:Polyketide cyclase / dehydrase and lipid transport